jgi:hypothetical protein
VELAVQAGIEELLNGFGNALGTALHGVRRFDYQQTSVSGGRVGLSEERAGGQQGDERKQRNEKTERASETKT